MDYRPSRADLHLLAQGVGMPREEVKHFHKAHHHYYAVRR